MVWCICKNIFCFIFQKHESDFESDGESVTSKPPTVVNDLVRRENSKNQNLAVEVTSIPPTVSKLRSQPPSQENPQENLQQDDSNSYSSWLDIDREYDKWVDCDMQYSPTPPPTSPITPNQSQYVMLCLHVHVISQLYNYICVHNYISDLNITFLCYNVNNVCLKQSNLIMSTNT